MCSKFIFATVLLLSAFTMVQAQGSPIRREHVNRDRESVRKAYIDTYLPAQEYEVGYTQGRGCEPGSLSKNALKARLAEINFFRNLAGLPPVTFDPALNLKAQAAAHLMYENGALSHNPAKDWKCYSELAGEGAGSSNLHLGWGGPVYYMFDYGDGNRDCGHRMWILHSRAETFGYGATAGSHALCVFGDRLTPDTLPKFIAWPPAGFMPEELLTSRWSFSVAERYADYSTAKVKMTHGGRPLPLLYQMVTVYGDNGLAWEMDGYQNLLPSLLDTKVKVEISGIKVGDQIRSYSYEVIPFKAVQPILVATNDTDDAQDDPEPGQAEPEIVTPFEQRVVASEIEIAKSTELPLLAFNLLRSKVASDLKYDNAFGAFARRLASIRKEKNPTSEALQQYAESKIRAHLAHLAGMDEEQAQAALAPKFILLEMKKSIPLSGAATFGEVAQSLADAFIQDGSLRTFALKYRTSRQCGIGLVTKRFFRDGKPYAGVYATIVLSPAKLRMAS